MSTQILLIGSIVIGSLLLLTILNLNATITNASHNILLENAVQQRINTAATLINYDFRKLGYRVQNQKILNASNSSITFASDLDDNGTEEVITYWVQQLQQYATKFGLFRKVNNSQGVSISEDVKSFELTYYDRDGNETQSISNIASIGIKLVVESINPYRGGIDVGHARGTWQTKISPPNLIYVN